MKWEKRADWVSAMGISFVAGWVACAASNNVAQLWKDHAMIAPLKKELSVTKCNERKARDTAWDAIEAALDFKKPVPLEVPKCKN